MSSAIRSESKNGWRWTFGHSAAGESHQKMLALEFYDKNMKGMQKDNEI
jgi:hypothetical protein